MTEATLHPASMASTYPASLASTAFTDADRPSVHDSEAPLAQDDASTIRTTRTRDTIRGTAHAAHVEYERACKPLSPSFTISSKGTDRAWKLSHDGHYLVFDQGDGNVMLWDIEAKVSLPLQSFFSSGPGRGKSKHWAVTCFAFDLPTRRLACAHANGYFTVWDFDGQLHLQAEVPIIMNTSDPITHIAFTNMPMTNESVADSLLVFQRRRLARIVDMTDLTNMEWLGASDTISLRCKKNISFSLVGHVLAFQRWYGNPDIQVINVRSDRTIARIMMQDHPNLNKFAEKMPFILRQALEDERYVTKLAPYVPCALANDARSIAFINTSEEPPALNYYDLANKTVLWQRTCGKSEYSELTFSHDNTCLAAISKRKHSPTNKLRLWNCKTGNSQILMFSNIAEIKGLAFSKYGTLRGWGRATHDASDKVYLFELATPEVVQELVSGHLAESAFGAENASGTRHEVLPGLIAQIAD